MLLANDFRFVFGSDTQYATKKLSHCVNSSLIALLFRTSPDNRFQLVPIWTMSAKSVTATAGGGRGAGAHGGWGHSISSTALENPAWSAEMAA